MHCYALELSYLSPELGKNFLELPLQLLTNNEKIQEIPDQARIDSTDAITVAAFDGNKAMVRLFLQMNIIDKIPKKQLADIFNGAGNDHGKMLELLLKKNITERLPEGTLAEVCFFTASKGDEKAVKWLDENGIIGKLSDSALEKAKTIANTNGDESIAQFFNDKSTIS